jgi:proteasome assembly chaperone (PAC2) family protein
MGYLAKLSADYLRRRLNAELFAKIRYYNNVIVYKDGLVELAPIHHQFYMSTGENLIICIGDAQPSTPEETIRLGESIIDLACKYQVRRIYTIAAYPNEFFDQPNVYGVFTDESLRPLLEKKNVKILNEEGAVNGLNGVLIGLAKNSGIEGICLMSDIRYSNVPQHLSSKTVLDSLLDLMGIEIDTVPLGNRAKKIDASIQKHLEVSDKDAEYYITPEKKLGYIS